MKEKNNINMDEIKTLINNVERTKKYDRKRISEYNDQIFGKEERPDNNDPCPIMQMRKIKAWYQDQKKR